MFASDFSKSLLEMEDIAEQLSTAFVDIIMTIYHRY